tara:strand:- start:199 stop:549 length:351 start_codon:yes stop_codon:yes gene_type:complete
MKKTTLILLLALPFMGKAQMGDKTKHMIAGHVTSTTVGVITYKFTNKPLLSGTVGFLAGVLVSDLKERYDRSQGREYSTQDLVSGIWGSSVGFACTIPLTDIMRRNKNNRNQIKNK